jgi:hypothetical protein
MYPREWPSSVYVFSIVCGPTQPDLAGTKGVGPGPTLALPGWKQPDIPVEVDTDRLENSRLDAEVLKTLSLAGIAQLSRLKYR